MTASVTITTKKESGICIPMTALYSTIDPTIMKQFEKKGYSFQLLYKNNEELAQGLKDITRKTIWVKKGEKSYEQRSVGVGLNNGVKASSAKRACSYRLMLTFTSLTFVSCVLVSVGVATFSFL